MTLVTLAASTLAMGRLTVSSELTGHLGEDRALADDARYRAWFPGTEAVVLEVSLPVIDGGALGGIMRLERRLRTRTYVREVLSLADHIPERLTDPNQVVEYFQSPRRLERFLGQVGDSRTARALLLAPGARRMGVLVALEPAPDSRRRTARLDELLALTREAFPGTAVGALGYPVVESRILEHLRTANRRFVPAAVLGGALLLRLFIGDLRWMLLCSLSAFAPLVWMLGAMAIAGQPLHTLFTLLFPAILSIGLSSTLYVYCGLRELRELPAPEREAELARRMMPAQILSNVTTALGFLSLTLSPAPALVRLGAWAAVGTLMAFVAPLVLLPGAARRRELPARAPRLHDSIAAPDLSRSRTALAALGTVSALSLLGLGRMHPATSPTAVLLPDDPVIRLLEAHHRDFGWKGSLELCVRFAHGRPEDARNMETLRKLEASVETDPRVHRALGLEDLYLDIGSRISGRRLEAIRTPTERKQYQRFLAPHAGPVSVFVSPGGEATRLFLTLRTDEAFEVVDFATNLPRHAAALGQGDEMFLAGPEYLAAVVHRQAVMGGLGSFVLSVISVILVVIVVFRSLTAGVILAAANVLPLLAVYGMMGWSGVPVDIGASILGPVILGIVVDDTIHMFHRTRAERALDSDIARAVDRTMEGVGPAMMTTAMTMASGLLLSALTPLAFSRRFGLLSFITLVVALLTELILTPRLLRRMGGEITPRDGGP